MKVLSKCYMALIFLLLYAPILVLVIFSFNESGSLSTFSGFSFKWYRELFRDTEALSALKNSLILALCSSALATVIGTLGALGIDRMRRKGVKAAIRSLTNVPMMNPDIVTGVSMMLLFVAIVIAAAVAVCSIGLKNGLGPKCMHKWQLMHAPPDPAQMTLWEDGNEEDTTADKHDTL